MRSLAAQLVALALAVPFSTASSSHATSQPHTTLSHHATAPLCGPYCQARSLRRELRIVHRRAVALARHAALPVPPPAHLGWRQTALRAQLSRQVRVLGRYRAEARRPLRLRLSRFEAWVCIHHHEGAWNDAGDPYWGGLQMDRGFMLAYGGDMIRRHHGGLANTWTPAEQIIVAERAYKARGFAPWPETSRSCGLR
jgi:hypothetical protein